VLARKTLLDVIGVAHTKFYTRAAAVAGDMISLPTVPDLSGHGVVCAAPVGHEPRAFQLSFVLNNQPYVRHMRVPYETSLGVERLLIADTSVPQCLTNGGANFFAWFGVDWSQVPATLCGNYTGVFSAQNGIAVLHFGDGTVRFDKISKAGGGTVRLARQSTHVFMLGEAWGFFWSEPGDGTYRIDLIDATCTIVETLTGVLAGAADVTASANPFSLNGYALGGSPATQDWEEWMIADVNPTATQRREMLAIWKQSYGRQTLPAVDTVPLGAPYAGDLKVVWWSDSRGKGNRPGLTLGGMHFFYEQLASGDVVLNVTLQGPFNDAGLHDAFNGAEAYTVTGVPGHSVRAPNANSDNNFFGPGQLYNDFHHVIVRLGINWNIGGETLTQAFDQVYEMALSLVRLAQYATHPVTFVIIGEPWFNQVIVPPTYSNQLIIAHNRMLPYLALFLRALGYRAVVRNPRLVHTREFMPGDDIHENDDGSYDCAFEAYIGTRLARGLLPA
jgi:hypothetical protein